MGRRERMFKWLFYALVALYLLNCLTPLRLHVDMLRYFAIKDCIELGCPVDSVAAKDYLPYGYTVLLLFLNKLHILHSAVLVFINCIYLFGALVFVRRIFGGVLDFYFFAVAVLLNWTIVKFVTHPLSEMQFLFFSMASVYYFQVYSDVRKAMPLILSICCCGLAFLTRSVGLALAASLVAGLIWMYRQQLMDLVRRNKVLVGILIVCVVSIVVFSRLLGLDHYTGVFTKQFQEGLHFSTMLEWHFREWTEIYANTSIVKLFPYMNPGLVRNLFFLTGILFVAGFLWLLMRAKQAPVIVRIYILFYILLMFDWPFYDPRFWVPVIPLVVAVVLSFRWPRVGVCRVLASAWLGVYLVLGVVSAGYMTYTSLNRRLMVRTHANGVYRNEYETVFYGKPQSDTARHIDSAALSVIRRYD
jgi:hypothetical protein